MIGTFKVARLLSGFAVLCSSVLLTATAFGASAQADENAKWFVVRHHTTSDCWTAKLIEVNGEYVHAFAQLAGGPYDSKQQAQEREAALVKDGTCKQ
ncbi:MAG: hypothetical protein KDJ45_15710 [Hyphomicrobiaceae bacterium]|nr:hypothetical protein [Hyphomicrobiaceae bacterium]